MTRKVKRKKLGTRIFVIFLLMVVIAVFIYKFIIIPGKHHISEKEYNDKASSYSSSKIAPGSSDVETVPVPLPKIEPDPSVPISLDKLNSPNAILIRLKDHTILMKKKQ